MEVFLPLKCICAWLDDWYITVGERMDCILLQYNRLGYIP